MENLTATTIKKFNKDSDPKTVSSREVADMMEVRHDNIIRKIEKLDSILKNSNLSCSKYWIESSYRQAGNGKECKEYEVTKKGCELIAHKTEGEKGVIFTVRYMERFDEMEQMLDVSMLPPEMQMFKQLFDQQARIYLDSQKMQQQIDETNNKVDNIRDVISVSYKNWRSETSRIINRIANSDTFIVEGNPYIAVREESYDALEQRFGVKLKTRLVNKKQRMAYEGTSKSVIDKMSRLDVIADDKKLIEGYTMIIKEMAIKYGVA